MILKGRNIIKNITPLNNGEFNFTINSTLRTSAGVFKDDTLIKTLWNDELLSPNIYTRYWDGTDDLNNVITSPESTYEIKILTNDVSYEWEGTIGNNSDDLTGDGKYRGYYNAFTGMAIADNGYGYYATGFSEGYSSYGKFLISQPRKNIDFYAVANLTQRIITLNTDFVCTDNTNVYFAGTDAYSFKYDGLYKSMVHAIKCSDDTNVIFTNGSSYQVAIGSVIFPSVIASDSNVILSLSKITGLAVQKTGNYLFVARAGKNELKVFDKTSGALVQTLSITTPSGLSIDNNDNLWGISSGTVYKYGVNTDGSLTTPLITISGLSDPFSTGVSNDGTTVAICDGGVSQQVKFYNNTTGAYLTVLGNSGGYFSDATVTNDKFYFNDINGNKPTFVVYQSDGSFWVNDFGNNRTQHYNSSKVYTDRIMFLGSSYRGYVDRNNPSRLFSEGWEYEIDYSQPLVTGWSLKNNWNANKPGLPTYDGEGSYFTTFSNGRCYGFLRKDANFELIEMVSGGQIRFTGVIKSGLGWSIFPDGGLQERALSGNVYTMKKYALIGFDVYQNPIWSTTSQLLGINSSDSTIGNPVQSPLNLILTNNNRIVWYNYKTYSNSTPTIHSGYHLGIQAIGTTNTFLAQTEKSTHEAYSGTYPKAGWYEVGNAVNNNSGGTLSIVGNYLYTSHHDENWKGSQTNKFNMYNSDGLAIGQFGTIRTIYASQAGEAGNALTPMAIQSPIDANVHYMYHGDEAAHSGIHRWKISGLNTISEQVVTIPFPSAYTPITNNYVDLMLGLPNNSTLTNNTAGWTRSPIADYTNSSADFFKVNTDRQSYDLIKEKDITVEFQSETIRTNTLSRDLGTNDVTNNWTIVGELLMRAGANMNGAFAQQFLEVLDSTGKELITFYVTSPSTNIVNIFCNSVLVATSDGIVIPSLLKTAQLFKIEIVEGTVTFTFANYTPITTTISDLTGNWRTPKTLRIRIFRNSLNNPARFQTITLKDFKLFTDY